MDSVPFHSREPFYKSRFGAVKVGETFWLRLVLPRSFIVSAAYFMLRRDGGAFAEHRMCWAGLHGEDAEVWDLRFTVWESGLFWYHFDYEAALGRGSVCRADGGAGAVCSEGSERRDWQLTVYESDFKTPDWFKGGIAYQIFPDRFYRSGVPKKDVPADRVLREDWGGQPYWRPNAQEKALNSDYFCGDLKGIEEKLPYLESLGVTCIYLNPIFEAHSNHRYNTADYEKIDPLLGTQEDFEELCASAKRLGIHILLDGVFSHTGDDSRYFNRRSRYPTLGAYNSVKSPYFPWYRFQKYPAEYRGWWGIDTLPEVDEDCPSYDAFINGRDGIVRKWLRLGASGWRLDVADELPGGFIERLRAAAKAEKSDALVLGEVWEDATAKLAYGSRRRYLLGRQLDSVTNYPFARAILRFAAGGDAADFMSAVCEIVENYPKEALDVLMNPLGTHDTARALTALAGEELGGRGRQWQAVTGLGGAEYARGVRLLKLAAVLQYTLPGVPCIYYGDEAGAQGYLDPFNRGCYPWGKEDGELLAFYRRLGNLRRACPCLADGDFMPVSASGACVAYTREKGGRGLLVVANRGERELDYGLPEGWRGERELLRGEETAGRVSVPALSAVILKR